MADQPVHAAQCLTHNGQGDIQYFAWLASFPLRADNVAEAANQGGRQRWRIENEGFWTQKHGDFELEHIYSNDLGAQKNYYSLLQIAHFMLQLLKHGRLRKVFRERIRSLNPLRQDRRLPAPAAGGRFASRAWAKPDQACACPGLA